MRALSLFDGMSCGMLAFLDAGIPVEQYIAYEIDKYAIQTSAHNFPMVEHMGDVFGADFTKYQGIDFLIGGSPCTYWSIAQKNHRETEASGLGWELFSQYVRALHEAKPRFFIYENNKSMSKEIRDSIRETFGFEEICINSALVSAQNRQRYYWVGKRNEDGTYSRVNVQQPHDRGILMRDVLDGIACSVPVNTTKDGKAKCVRASCYKDGIRNIVGNQIDRRTGVAEPVEFVSNDAIQVGSLPRPNGELSKSAGMRVFSIDGKGRCLIANGGGMGAKTGLYAAPVCVAQRERYDENGKIYQHYEARSNEKTSVLTTVSKDNLVAEPIPCYAVACEWDKEGNPTKAFSCADRKIHEVYKVTNGIITINNKSYPIKLQDGYWIIRKLTVNECKHLQTVPEWFEFPVSDTQAYKMLGNGWTVQVISHLIQATQQ